jgi:hypothetical protein
MKQSVIKLSKFVRFGSIMTVLLGMIHVLATSMVYHSGFDQLPVEMAHCFLSMFISTGLGLIFVGGIAVYSTVALRRGEKGAFNIILAAGSFILLVGIGAVVSLPHNPFAYMTFSAALIMLIPLVAIRRLFRSPLSKGDSAMRR